MKIDVLNIKGEQTGRSVDLPDHIFSIEPNQHVVWLAVKQYLAHQRQGTHKSKERNEVAGSTRKLHRQKGTGGSRKGDIKNPLFRGGGRVFGPEPRTYGGRLNKKVSRLARKSALSAKAGAGKILVVEDFSFDAPRTGDFKGILDSLKVSDKKALLVTADVEKELVISSRNIPKASVARAQDLNTYQVMKADAIILSEGAVARLGESFGK